MDGEAGEVDFCAGFEEFGAFAGDVESLEIVLGDINEAELNELAGEGGPFLAWGVFSDAVGCDLVVAVLADFCGVGSGEDLGDVVGAGGKSGSLFGADDAGEEFLNLEGGVVFLAGIEAGIAAAAVFVRPYFAEVGEEGGAAAGGGFCEIGHLAHLGLGDFGGFGFGAFEEAEVADEIAA